MHSGASERVSGGGSLFGERLLVLNGSFCDETEDLLALLDSCVKFQEVDGRFFFMG